MDVSFVFVVSMRLINWRGSKEFAVEVAESSEESGFSWTSPDRMIHKCRVNVVAVLFHLGLYGGGVISNPVGLFDLRQYFLNTRVGIVHGASRVTSLNGSGKESNI